MIYSRAASDVFQPAEGNVQRSGEECCICIPDDLSEIFNITKKIQEVNKDIRKLETLIPYLVPWTFPTVHEICSFI